MDATLFLNGKPWHVDGDVIKKYSPNLAIGIHCDQSAVHLHLNNPAELKRLGDEIVKLADALQRDLYPDSLPALVHSSQVPALSVIDESS